MPGPPPRTLGNLFWLAIFADDAAISPIAFVDLPARLLVLVAVVHVASAPVGWIIGLVRLQRAGRGMAVVIGVLAVPLSALMTLGVMLSDATVWRGDLDRLTRWRMHEWWVRAFLRWTACTRSAC